MSGLSQFAYTNNMASGKQPFLTDLVETLDSIQTEINDNIIDNLNQISLDAYGSGYTYDSDGLAQYTQDLYNKTKSTANYTGGDITISATGAWTDVDATNAKITVTPELTGHFKVTFQFNVESVTSNATNETDLRFRLTDSTTNSTVTPRIKLVTGVTTTTNTTPVTLEFTFPSLSAALKTFKLQYYITTSTATTIKVLANSNDPLYMETEKT